MATPTKNGEAHFQRFFFRWLAGRKIRQLKIYFSPADRQLKFSTLGEVKFWFQLKIYLSPARDLEDGRRELVLSAKDL